VAEPWATFLASGSTLTLHLLREPRSAFQARSLVVQNWMHCLNLITRCQG
jgi:hypothetical protein